MENHARHLTRFGFGLLFVVIASLALVATTVPAGAKSGTAQGELTVHATIPKGHVVNFTATAGDFSLSRTEKSVTFTVAGDQTVTPLPADGLRLTKVVVPNIRTIGAMVDRETGQVEYTVGPRSQAQIIYVFKAS